MRKLLVCTLVVALCALASLPVLAADPVVAGPAFSDITGDDAEYELTVMAALGIMTGDIGIGGPARPEATITRAEICKILVGALGYARMEPIIKGVAPSFKDAAQIQPWAWGWINIAQQLQLIGGYPDGTFKANNTVNYAEVVAMLVRCVFGHEAQVKKSLMPWPMNYIGWSAMYGFSGDVVPFAQLPAIRGDVAKMILATMQVNQITGEGLEKPNSSLLSGRIISGALNSFTGTAATIGTTSHQLVSPYYLVGGTSLSQMQYVDVLGILDKKTDGKWVLIKKIGSSSSAGGLVYTGTKTSGSTTYLTFQGGKEIPYRNPVPTTLNGDAAHNETNLLSGDLCSVLQGGDQYALYITATRWDIGQDYLNDVDASHGLVDTQIYTQSHGNFSVPGTNCTVLVNGSASGRDNLAVKDVVKIATLGADNAVVWRVEATRRTVEGTVSNVSTSYPGPVIRVEINRSSGGKATYVLDQTYLSEPANGAQVKYGLDDANKLYVPITLTETHPYVLITASESGSTFRVTCNYRGTSPQYTCTSDMHAFIGQFGLLTINTSNVVTAFTPMAVGGMVYEVLTHSASNATVREDGNPSGTVRFISNSDAYVYRWNSGTSSYTYIGTGLLVDAGHVQADSSYIFWVYTP